MMYRMSSSRICAYILLSFSVVFLAACANNQNPPRDDGFPEIEVDYSDVGLFYSVIEKAEKQSISVTGKYMYENYVLKAQNGLRLGYVVNREDMFPVENGLVQTKIYEQKLIATLPFFLANKKVIQNQSFFSKDSLKKISKNICAFTGYDFCKKHIQGKKIYFSISGALNMGGTAFQQGVFMDVSMIYDERIDYSLLPKKVSGLKNMLPRKKDAAYLAVHEFMHVLQLSLKEAMFPKDRVDPVKILLLEGGADFLAMNIVPASDVMQEIRNKQSYMRAHPEKYTEFLEDMKILMTMSSFKEQMPRWKKWFFNRTSSDVMSGKYLPDLGYYIGREVTRTFYEQELQTGNKDDVLNRVLKRDIPFERIEVILQELAKQNNAAIRK